MLVTTPFADRFTEAAQRLRAPVCVGLDPVIEHLPPEFRRSADEAPPAAQSGQAGGARSDPGLDMHNTRAADALRGFCRRVIDIVAPYVPAVKVNIAFFERYRGPGVAAYFDVVRCARQAGLLVIGDVKRGDIGHSAAQYAAGHLQSAEDDPAHVPAAAAKTGRTGPANVAVDAVTVSPYLGFDGVSPFIDAAAQCAGGVFVLVQTSNDSAAAIQGLALANGQTVAEAVAAMVESWSAAAGPPGAWGYGCVGAVVSPRDVESTGRLRAMMPNCLFLVPGFGAQGRSAEEVARCFKANGTGAVVNASRSVIRAFGEPAYRSRFHDDWATCTRQACIDFVDQIRAACGV